VAATHPGFRPRPPPATMSGPGPSRAPPMQPLLLAIPLGLVTGAMLGVLGAGGSVLTVPALVYLLDQPVGMATTAALVIVSANAALGAGENARRRTVDVRLAAEIAASSICGALLGSWLNHMASGTTVLVLLALVMLASAWSLWRGGPTRDRVAPGRRVLRHVLIALLGFAIGVLTGFFGVGGGFLIVPALILLLGLPARLAIGTSLLVITVTGLAGLGGHLLQGGIAWGVTLAFAAAGLAGVWLGARGSVRASGETLSRAFAAMLVLVAVFLLATNGIAVA
jgi:uncharacterized protein